MTHIDSLRGALLVLMAVNHIPSALQPLTNHFFGFVSAAEGFVFLSGLMCGLVYSKRYYKYGAAEMKEAATRRAVGVYLYHIVTFVTVLVGLALFAFFNGQPAASAAPVLVQHPIGSLLSGIVLLQQPSLFDILPLYCVFLLALPWMIIACASGHRKAVLAASALIWLLSILFSPQKPLIDGFINTGSFNLLAWQLLFVVGTVMGHGWAADRALLRTPRSSAVAGAFIVAAILFAVRHAWLTLAIPPTWLEWLTNKNSLAPVRLLNVGLIFYLVYALVSRAPALFAWRPLAFLGQHSIFIFAVHILVAYSIQSFPDVFETTYTGHWFATLIMVCSLFVAANIHKAWQTRAKRISEQVSSRQLPVATSTMGYESRTFSSTNPVRN